mgnify:CR=1 FL=1
MLIKLTQLIIVMDVIVIDGNQGMKELIIVIQVQITGYPIYLQQKYLLFQKILWYPLTKSAYN